MMNDVVKIAEEEIKKLGFTANGEHIKTGDIRKLSAKLYRSIGDKSKDTVFLICESLLEQRNWPMEVIAFDFAYRVKKQYDENTFSIFEGWLIKYVRGWGDCDDFCTHGFGELIMQNTSLVHKIIPWTERNEALLNFTVYPLVIASIHNAVSKWVLPVPEGPNATMLRLSSTNLQVANSMTSSLLRYGNRFESNLKVSNVLITGKAAFLILYLYLPSSLMIF